MIIKVKNIVIILIVFAITIFSLTCNKNNYNVSKNKVLRIGILSFPKSLNPAYVTDEQSTIIANKVYDALYYFDNNGEAKSRIIKSEKIIIEDNATIIEILLKKDIFFSDGKVLTANDIIKTLKLLKNEKFFSPYRVYLGIIKDVKQKSKFRIIFKLNKKNANWRNYLTFKILNSNEIKNIDPNIFKSKVLSGTGPLKFELINRPSKIVFSINKFYKTNTYKIKKYTKVEYLVVLYTHNSPLKLMNNEIDIIGLPHETVSVYKSNLNWQKNYNLLKYNKFGYTYLVFNLNKKKLNLNIRKIIYTVLHTNGFLKRFIKNKGKIVKSPFLLLNKDIRTSLLITNPLKNKIKISILSNTKSRIKREFILFLVKELKDYNIHLKPVFLEHQLMLAKIKKKDFEMAISGFLLDIDYDMKDILYSSAYFNYSGYKSKQMDKYLDMGLNEFNMRKDIYIKAHNLWTKDLPFIPLYNLYYYMGVSKQVKIPTNITSLVGSSGDFLQNIDKWIYQPN